MVGCVWCGIFVSCVPSDQVGGIAQLFIGIPMVRIWSPFSPHFLKLNSNSQVYWLVALLEKFCSPSDTFSVWTVFALPFHRFENRVFHCYSSKDVCMSENRKLTVSIVRVNVHIIVWQVFISTSQTNLSWLVFLLIPACYILWISKSRTCVFLNF